MHRKCLIIFLVYSILAITPVLAVEKPKVPEPLKPWVDWVLHDHQEELLCTANYNNPNNFKCNWPTALNLDIKARTGSFSQTWSLEHESWIQLPGNKQVWPEQVTVNGKKAIVLKLRGTPQIKLQPGNYKISGSFNWKSMPEFMQINAQTGLLSLKINGKSVDSPGLDDSGRVWLHSKKRREKTIENSLKIQAFRMIDDQIPARITLKLDLDVAGSAREVLLGIPFSAQNFIPVSLNSSLPARLEKDGRIRLQIRPGQWQITLTARHVGPLASLDFSRPEDDFWPEQEIWVFAKQNNRIVEIEGVPSIDPQQTTLPSNWRNMPAYRLMAGDKMNFKQVKRGDPQPAPDQLSLQRNLWLRFDGSGYTIQDQISGKKTSNWRLEMASPITLGRVAVGGIEQFITRMTDSPNTGVELRNGAIEISADSEYQGGLGKIPATGWNHDFQKVSAKLFLPPGYRLLHATGIDNIPATWLNHWTLLDIFVLLIFTITLAKLYSKPMAAIGFVTLALLYHEPGAPRWVWLAILIGVALIRTIPNGRFRKSVKIYHGLTFLILIIIAIPFSINHLRIGIFPQLEKPWQTMVKYQSPRLATPIIAEQKQMEAKEDSIVMESARRAAKLERRTASLMQKAASVGSSTGYSRQKQVAQYDPSMINQTGPGIPIWQWNVVLMGWSGPVKSDQQITLTLIGPKTNLALAFARVALMILLALGILGTRYGRGKGWQLPDPKKFLIIPLLLFPLLLPTNSQGAEIPSPELFEELRLRLLEKDDCFPNCADIPTMSLDISPSELAIEFNVMAQVKVAIPLPGNPRHWSASTVQIDTLPAKAMYRTSQGLWVVIPQGKHTIRLKGKISPNDSLQLTLPLKPHQLKINQTGWTIEGTHRDGTIDNQLHFKRIVKQEKQTRQIFDTGILPSFLLIERSLQLGLNWRVETMIRRISPAGSAIIIEYPLLPGEAVVSSGITVKDGKAQINIDPRSTYLKFESVLEKNKEITLKHAETNLWTETWQVDTSPIFHLEYDGIPVILHQIGNRWAPKWHPWPNEKVTLKISRPTGVTGQSITIDKSELELKPGRRATDAKLDLSLRSSQGGQHTITLPPDSQLQEVQINGRLQSIRQEGRNVPLPIIPGKQEITLKWREATAITANYKTSEIDLGLANANINIDLHLPQNRWPLMVCGPAIGPAILFWSVVLVIILVAFGLARSKLTSLKFYQLLLLGIGMCQSNLIGVLLVVGWLITLDYRKKLKPSLDHGTFNLIQIGLGTLTIMAIISLIFAISQGLLGHPDMNIVGNGSSRNLLRWYQDYSLSTLPQAWLLSIPMFWYRLAMLAWALWLSFSLIRILRDGWQSFSEPILWHPTTKKKKEPKFSKKNTGEDEEIDLTADMQIEEKNQDPTS